MIQILDKEEVKFRKHELLTRIKDGAVFIHPTDTIYGLSCDATNEESVSKIRELKQRKDSPFSVIAPSLDWIRENCEVTEEAETWLKKLPGPYTLILKLKNKDSISPSTAPGSGSVGVRIPDHWVSEAVASYGKPIITTSANVAGKEFMTSLENLDSKVKQQCNFIIYEGEKQGSPSNIVFLDGRETKIKER